MGEAEGSTVSESASGSAAAGPGEDRGRLVAGRYRLLERIGRGGMGTVWRAEDSLLDRQVALKQLHVAHYLDEDELATLYERTRREARSAARINHPNVVVVHDVVEDRGLPCIVMEYVPSTTLGDVLKSGTITPDEAARIGRGMIAALRAAHAAGVLHRDVKPGNVLLGEGGRVVLTDFGIAQSTGTSTLTKTGEMVGSIDYIAPERVKGAKPGPAADLWALGATLYQALEGRPPFRKDTAVETAYAIAMDPLPPPRHAGPLTRLVETLLAKDPALRPPAELAEQILREPAAESETAVHPALSEPVVPSAAEEKPAPADAAGPGTRTDDTARTQAGPRADAVRTAGEAATEARTEAAPAGPPAPPGGRARKGRALLWSAVAVVALAGVAGGLYVHFEDGGTSDEAVARDEPGKEAASGGPRPGPKPSPSASSYSPPPVPAGYHLVEEKRLGVSFPVPDGWTRQEKSAVEVDYLDRTTRVGLKINVLDFAGPDHLQHWKDVEDQLKTEVNGYKRGRMQETSFRGEPAAVWEFTFQGRAREYRAIDLGFGKEGGSEYAIYLSAPSADWDRYRPVFDVVSDGFRPKR
ncbi:serine/threonine-protein kinase [Streptomyces sp. NPDC020379]|uniref:serine/threonine-protein kinase n=1 Tax=Streptomyces sp. NPDC020379 TaxID=3365071 RepID=UPI0037BCF6A3